MEPSEISEARAMGFGARGYQRTPNDTDNMKLPGGLEDDAKVRLGIGSRKTRLMPSGLSS